MGLRLAIKVAYFNITDFSHGFQIQPDVETIFSFLTKALKKTDFWNGKDGDIEYAGRTDHGVNAICQVIAINLKDQWETVPERLLQRINTNLPKNIRCWAYCIVTKEFHPRFNALERSYVYIYTLAKEEQLNLLLMKEASSLLEGYHDFTNFSKRDMNSKDQFREVNVITILENLNHIFITIKAKSFLWQQCRRIASHLVQIGTKQVTLKNTKELLTNIDLVIKPTPLPPENLILTNIEYQDLIFFEENSIKLKIIQSLMEDIHQANSKVNTLNYFSKLLE